jgi:glutamate synthase (ferredoxin)
MEAMTLQQAQQNYRKAVENGLLKILSKMGILCFLVIKGRKFLKPLALVLIY